MLSLILTVTFLVLMFLRVPVYFSIGLSTLIPLLLAGKNLVAIPQFMQEGVHSSALLAVPFFIIAGNVFSNMGLSRRIFDFAKTIVGHWRGGLGHVIIVAEMIFSGVSGSALADISALGLIGIPEMEKMGYRRPFATAIVLSSGVLGPIIPPSIGFVIYGVVAEVSIGRLFLGGVIPGIVIGGCLMGLIYYFARKGIEPCPVLPKQSFKGVAKSFLVNSPTLLVPVVIILGMAAGLVTPTEVGVLATLIGIVLGIVYGTTSKKELINCFESSAKATALIMYVIAVSTIAGWIYSYEGVAQKIAGFMLQLTANKYLLLVFINFFLLLLGALLEPIPALILTTPLFMPIIQQVGIDPVHFGIIICYNTTIGIITPPIGIGLYVMMGVIDIKFEDLVKAAIPFYIPLIISLFILSYIPELTTFLPNLLMGKP
jgi:C4-dicarboxylate transporter, DctM subunit